MTLKYFMIGAIVLFIVGMLVISSYAAIDPRTVVGMWVFDEDNDDTARDLSGNGNDGEIMEAKWEDGKIGKAFRFDGGNSVIQIPHSNELSLENFTAMAWIKLEAVGKWQYILCKTPPAPPPWQRNYSIQVWTGDTFLGGFDDANGPWTGTLGATRVTDGEWHHVASTYDKKVLKVYVDGVVDGQQNISVDPVTNTDMITIGTNVINQGLMDLWMR